jgi:hypothetical protein
MRLKRGARSVIEMAAPAGRRLYQKVRALGQLLRPRAASPQAVFSHIYRKNVWGNAESASGRGSTLERTRAIRGVLPGLLKELGAASLLDAACGDFNWMQQVDLGGVSYLGADVVPELVEKNCRDHAGSDRNFLLLDITRDQVPQADVILCRDCFIHLSFGHALRALANFKRSGAAYLLATTYPGLRENADIITGRWRTVNLQAPPFNLPAPTRLVVEDEEAGKCLGLWPLADW